MSALGTQRLTAGLSAWNYTGTLPGDTIVEILVHQGGLWVSNGSFTVPSGGLAGVTSGGPFYIPGGERASLRLENQEHLYVAPDSSGADTVFSINYCSV